ncbi:hypothetical protein FB45DRAFT_945987 [Roridomyces roridus]|uniref:F-box domain-containing protein n=1 Tax=Roridomyces roridus TaxID=1738132 RepID=A0AAD7B3H0_9AGAR|nr:hypothetical protein FB45DRAFT_945987 [Roridomyces roridus]
MGDMYTLTTALLLARSDSGSTPRVHDLIAECMANIVAFESQIKHLERLRAREYSLIAALRLVISPARTLPVDVLGRIFLLALDLGASDGTALGGMRGVLTVSHVCQQWRKAALETPQLWATQPFPIVSDGRQLRSAPLPIPVSFGEEGGPLVEVLCAIAKRWRTLSLSTRLLGSLSKLSSGSLTALESLDLRGDKAERANPDYFPDLDTLPIPWSQLTTFALADESPGICLEIVSRCPSLVSATLHMSGWPQSVSPTDADPVLLPRMQSLEMHISNTLPSLTALKMYGEYHSGVITWSNTAFTHFQLRSPLIQQLQIDHCALTSEDLQAVVQHAPNLTHLEIYNCSNCIDDAFLAILRHIPSDASTPVVVPKLEVLWLSSPRCDFDEATLTNMVESRWWTDQEERVMFAPPAVVRLRDVKYTSSRRFSQKFERTVRMFREEGLKIQTTVKIS